MDSARFDALVKSVASSTSRRRVLAGLAGSVLGVLGLHGADARTCSAVGTICRENATCCSGICSISSDRRRRCVPPACGTGGPCTVFITAATYPGDLDGLIGADAKCQAAADNAALPGTFKAWLSDDTDSPSTRFYQSPGPYRLVNGTTIANSWADLTDGSLLAPITIDQTGASTVENGTRAWTHTLRDGTRGGVLNEDCENWTSADSGVNGDEGQPVSTSENWTEFAAGICNNMFRLYCFQQGV